MIKMLVGLGGGKKLLILGLDDRNIAKLTSGQPIRVEGAEFGIPFDIGIMHGPTQQDMATELRNAGIDIPEFTEVTTPGESFIYRRPTGGG